MRMAHSWIPTVQLRRHFEHVDAAAPPELVRLWPAIAGAACCSKLSVIPPPLVRLQEPVRHCISKGAPRAQCGSGSDLNRDIVGLFPHASLESASVSRLYFFVLVIKLKDQRTA